MEISYALYQLIQALSPAEKKYIRQVAKAQQKQPPAGYLKLFDALNSWKEYDKQREKELLQTVSGAENLAEIKKYLYNFILKNLRNFHSNKNYHIKIQEYRTNVHLLLEKGLWKQALKYIHKAQKLAQEAGFGTDELVFLLLERRIILQYSDKAARQLSSIQQASESRAAQQWKEVQMLKCYEEVFQAMRRNSGATLSLEQLQHSLDEIIGTAHESYLKLASFDAKIYYYYYILSSGYRAAKDYNMTNFYLKEMLHLFQKNPNYLQESEYQERYIRILNNYFNNCIYLKTLDENFPDIIEKIKLLPEKNHRLKAEKFQNEYYIKLSYYLQKADYETLGKLTPTVEQGLQLYQGSILINRRITLEYQLAVTYFVRKEYDKAWEYLNKLLNEKSYEVRQEILLLAETMRLIVFLEKQLYRLLRNTAHAFLENYAQQKGSLHVTIGQSLYQIAHAVADKELTDNQIQMIIRTALTQLWEQAQPQLRQHEELDAWLSDKMAGFAREGIL